MKKYCYKLAIAFIMLCTPVLGYSLPPDTVSGVTVYSSAYEKVLQKLSNSTWTVKDNQILSNWSENGNRLQAQKLTIKGKLSKSAGTIYFKPCKDLVVEQISDSEYKDNFQMSGIIVNEIGVSEDGSPIYPTKTQSLTVSNITFANFLTAITNKGGNISLSGTDFIKNKSETDGGAIYNTSGKLTISKGSDFIYNIAKDGKGGAIYNSGTLTVKNSTIGGQHNEIIYHIMNYNDNTADNSDTGIISESDVTYNLDGYLGSDNWITIYYLIPEWREKTYYNGLGVRVYPLGNEAKYGAGIYNDNIATISGTLFKYNIATADGGGVYNSGNLTLKNSELYRNSAIRGGGIFISEPSAGLTKKSVIQKTTFNLNSANDGGAIFNSGLNTSIVSSNFRSNSANQGGDIFNEGAMTISKSTFGFRPKKLYYFIRVNPLYRYLSGTTVSGEIQSYIERPVLYPSYYDIVPETYGSSSELGGAIYNIGDMTITSSKFYDVHANKGGAIYNANTNDNNKLVIKKSVFGGNYVSELLKTDDDGDDTIIQKAQGGVLYNKGQSTITKSTFTNNFATDGFGGAIYNEEGTVNIKTSVFKKNFAQSGGAIYTNCGTVSVSGSTFNGNYSTAGGAVFNNSKTTISSSVFILNNAFETVENTDDNGNVTTEDILTKGGAIYNSGSGNLSLESVTFGNTKKKYKYSNSAKDGSALYNECVVKDLKSKIVYQNSVNGAFYNTNELELDRTAFSYNKAIVGGAVYNAASGVSNILGATFKSNTATLGGAIYSEGTLNIGNSTYYYKKNKKLLIASVTPKFTSNSASEKGGAIFLSDTSNATISGASFKSNKAYKTTASQGSTDNIKITTPSGSGGAIYIGSISENNENGIDFGKTVIDNTTFTSNSAGLMGGAITVEGNSSVEINGGTFKKNTAYTAITTKTTTKNGKKTITTTTKDYQGSGGAVYSGDNSSLILSGVTFTGNIANRGGALYINNNNTTVSGSKFISNKTKGTSKTPARGGAIYLAEEKTSNIKSSTFTSNTAGFGGALYLDTNSVCNILDETSFVSNSASQTGGAVYIEEYVKPTTNTDVSDSFDDNSNTNSDNTNSDSSNEDNGSGENATDGKSNTSSEEITPTPSIFKNTTFSKNKANSGGAIFNAGYLDVVSNKFKYNSATTGGAIYNAGTLNIDSATFDSNKATSGGAIYNGGTLNIDNTKFYNTKKYSSKEGGSIYNTGTLSIKNSEFKNNKGTYGGAIINTGYQYLFWVIQGSINSESNNYTGNTSTYGGAILNSGKEVISKKDAFYKNSASVGGAIYNASVLKTDSTSFESNSSIQGGAIFNSSKLTISGGDIKNNDAYWGGGIYSVGNVTTDEKTGTKNYTSSVTIDGANFSGNYGKVYAGAIYLSGVESKIENSQFDGNHTDLYGGAILIASEKDCSTINSSEFKNNYVNHDGGAIYNSGTLKINIVEKADATEQNSGNDNNDTSDNTDNTDNNDTGNVQDDNNENNSTSENTSETTNNSDDENQNGGSSGDTVSYKTTVFDNNKAEYGGAICNSGTAIIDNVLFKNNRAKNGGAIYNEFDLQIGEKTLNENGEIITTDYDEDKQINQFLNNTATTGGAIYNDNKLYINGALFQDNVAVKLGGAIYSTYSTTIMNTKFDNNSSYDGGAIYYTPQNKTMNVISSKFVNNVVNNAGGAIYLAKNTSAQIVSTDFETNSGGIGGAIYMSENSKVVIQNNDFYNNSASGNGGAVYLGKSGKLNVSTSQFANNNARNGGAIFASQSSVVNITDVNFYNNKAENLGGAIYADKNSTVNIVSENRDVIFEGNKAKGVSNSIYLNSANLNLTANNDRRILINDDISGKGRITTLGTVEISNKAAIDKGSDITLVAKDGSLSLQNENSLLGGRLVLKSASLNIANGNIGTLSLDSLSLEEGRADVVIDMDLKTKNSDKIIADNYDNGIINVSKINLTSDSKKAVTVNVGKNSLVNSSTATTAQTKEATYKLKRSIDPETGLMRMTAYGQRAKSCTLAAPVAAQIGGYLTQINSYDQAFANMDMEMLQTREERNTNNLRNKTAYATDNSIALMPITYDNGINTDNKGLWTRPYATFERVNLNNGPKVSNIGYGDFFGGDLGYKQLSNGWTRQLSAYIGYNGSNQDFRGQSIDQNGGTIGLTEVWYKNNFFTGLTANVGANSANANTDLGNENFPLLMAGVASKTGYNFEFKLRKNGKYKNSERSEQNELSALVPSCPSAFYPSIIIQPSLLLSYSFVHTFSHDNGLGHKVGSSPLHAIQVAPGVKFIANLPKGWQPYLGVNMRWNIIDKTHFSLPDVTIQDMSIDPYVEYGIGVQRKWGERFTGYGQAMIRNGGRNGVMLSFGFRWALGK